MTAGQEADVRAAALDTYLARQAAQGFRIETRSGAQAVIVRRHRLHLLLRWVAHTRAEQRLVRLGRPARQRDLVGGRACSVVT